MNILSLLHKFTSKKIVYFGTGSNCDTLYNLLPFTVAYFVDNDRQKWDKRYKGLPVHSPEKLLTENKNDIIIIITSQFFTDIAAQLDSMGFMKDEHYFSGQTFLKYTDIQKLATYLDHPVNPAPRYGYGKPPHKKLYDLINGGRSNYSKLLQGFVKYKDFLKAIPIDAVDSFTPYWKNIWIPGLDALSIYCLIAEKRPKRYYEIGSGNSTKFARYAVKGQQLVTELVSIDPCPRAEIDLLCDQVYREPVEELNTNLFSSLQKGDILFIDNSHRCFTNSDVTTVFLDIIPYLNSGVLIGMHDIFLPYDYPPEWKNRYYSEQYLLATYLLAKGNSAKIILPNAFVTRDAQLLGELQGIWEDPDLSMIGHGGGIFWFEV